MDNFILKEKEDEKIEEINKKIYCNDDEIDLAEFLKTIIKEKKIVTAVTVIFNIIALCFGYYREVTPKNYTALVTLNNKAYTMLIPQNIYNEDRKNLPVYIQKIQMLVNSKKIDETILSNDIIKLEKKEDDKENNSQKNIQLKENEEKQQSFLEFFEEIQTLTTTEFLLSGSTKNKELITAENEIKDKIEILNKEINILFKENLNKEIEKAENRYKDLKNKALIINEQIKRLIEEKKIIFADKTIDSFALTEPVLYMKFRENQERMEKTYHNMQNLIFLKEISREKNILKLNFQNIKFDKSEISMIFIIVIGTILGLCAGIFIAVIKEPVKKILKEI